MIDQVYFKIKYKTYKTDIKYAPRKGDFVTVRSRDGKIYGKVKRVELYYSYGNNGVVVMAYLK